VPKANLIMGVSHSSRQDRSCPLDGEGKIVIIIIFRTIMLGRDKIIRARAYRVCTNNNMFEEDE